MKSALLALLALVLAVPPAFADSMSYFMQNAHPRAVVIELFSRDSDQRWPGDDKVFLLEKGERKTVPVECRTGETICYGAWVRGNDGVAWGVGPDNDRACDDCCVACVDKGRPDLVIE